MNFETCPGENKCAKQGPIFEIRQQEQETPICDICAVCKFLPTKPGQEPPQLALAIHTAYELGNLKSAGATFAYPDTLTAFEWVCLEALQAGKSASEAHGMTERSEQQHEQAEVSRLQQLQRR